LKYKKTHLGTVWKSNPFGCASHAKGIVVEKVISPFSPSPVSMPALSAFSSPLLPP
jgi:ribosomal protein S12